MAYKLEFLTPAFLYGADQITPEFRLASLIGQMRYWWRMTQKWPSNDFTAFKQKEGEIFGMPDEKNASAKSFYIYLTKRTVFTPKKAEQVRNRDGSFAKDKSGTPLFMFDSKEKGIQYFFYPLMRHAGHFSWIPVNTCVEFDIDFVNDTHKNKILLSLFLLSRFGGLGSRSRRGAGAFSLSGDDVFEFTEKDLIRYINSDDKKNMRGHQYFSSIQHQSPIWEALSNPARFKILNPKDDWEYALDDVGFKMQKMRTNFKGQNRDVDPDFTDEAIRLHQYFNQDSASDAPGAPLSKDAFGLPRIVNFSSTGQPNALTIAPYIKGEKSKEKETRRASPLHITINRKNNQYYATLLILWDGLDFLPEYLPIKIKNNYTKIYHTLSNPPVDKLEQFLKRL